MMRMIVAAVVAVWAALCSALAQDLTALARLDPQSSFIGDAGQGIAVSLALSQPVPWRLRVLETPPRLVLDVREVDWTGIADVPSTSLRVTDLRAGVFRPGWSRLVLELNGPFLVDQAEMRTADGAARLVLRLELGQAARVSGRQRCFGSSEGDPGGLVEGCGPSAGPLGAVQASCP